MQVFPVGPRPPAAPVGASVAWGTAGHHGALSHRLLGDRAGSCQVVTQSGLQFSEQPIRTLLFLTVITFQLLIR